MHAYAADPLFKLFAICAAILSLQMLLLAALTPARRAKVKNVMNPEDTVVSPQGSTLIDGAEHPDVARVQRAHRNLNESLPLFFALGLIYVLQGGSLLGGQICFIGFTVARALHSIVYLKALQPARTICYAIGAFALLGLIGMILVHALGCCATKV